MRSMDGLGQKVEQPEGIGDGNGKNFDDRFFTKGQICIVRQKRRGARGQQQAPQAQARSLTHSFIHSSNSRGNLLVALRSMAVGRECGGGGDG
ncbi:hypothetical protein niasHS_007119 [Heterodera schachtii]|uniref:Uncharacterized protein n=1 Tax=Heterodera schachtii TaxID=97005 RepID=A0ABD2JL41_HETSC